MATVLYHTVATGYYTTRKCILYTRKEEKVNKKLLLQDMLKITKIL